MVRIVRLTPWCILDASYLYIIFSNIMKSTKKKVMNKFLEKFGILMILYHFLIYCYYHRSCQIICKSYNKFHPFNGLATVY